MEKNVEALGAEVKKLLPVGANGIVDAITSLLDFAGCLDVPSDVRAGMLLVVSEFCADLALSCDEEAAREAMSILIESRQ